MKKTTLVLFGLFAIFIFFQSNNISHFFKKKTLIYESKNTEQNEKKIPTREALKIGLTLDIIDEKQIEQLTKLKIFFNNKIPVVFVYLPVELAFTCNFESENCFVKEIKLQENSVKKWLNKLKIVQSYADEVIFIYNFNINNFFYKLFYFKPYLEIIKIHGFKFNSKKDNEQKKMIFSDLKKNEIIQKNISRWINRAEIKKMIIGSELNLYFQYLSYFSLEKREIKGFWNLLEKIKFSSQKLEISSSFSYDHLRAFYAWGLLNTPQLSRLDFYSFTVYPLTKQVEGADEVTDPQFFNLSLNRKLFKETYFQDIKIKLPNALKPMLISEFGLPISSPYYKKNSDIIKDIIELGNDSFSTISWNLNTMSFYKQKRSQRNPVKEKYINFYDLFEDEGSLNSLAKLFFSLKTHDNAVDSK